MTLTDPIAQMLTTIRNGIASGKHEVVVPASKIKADILKVLMKNNFIESFKKEGEKTKENLVITPLYKNDLPVISKIKRVSKPGRRIYMDKTTIPTIKGGRGLVILSTSSGVIAGNDAKTKGVGGEVILEVW
ncbi:30S ribosomal protein S8 [bacterium]|nr:30S ribosomal protein S8 [bacterium]